MKEQSLGWGRSSITNRVLPYLIRESVGVVVATGRGVAYCAWLTEKMIGELLLFCFFGGDE